MHIQRLCVYCGASSGRDPVHLAAARRLGQLIAAAGIGLVYGGGGSGLMGCVARATLQAGGRVTGIIPRFLQRREQMLTGVSDLQLVDDMHQRKAQMMRLADAFVILPGGLGTLEETFEVLTWRQLALHDKPIVIVDVSGYWQPLVGLIAHVVAEGFAAPATTGLVTVVDSVDAVLPLLADQAPPATADRPGLI